MLKNNTLAIALASLLVGGVAVAAFQNSRNHADTSTAAMPAASADAAMGAEQGYLSAPESDRLQLGRTGIALSPLRPAGV